MSDNENIEVIEFDENEFKETKKVDKRKETSRLNMEKARKKRLESLEKQKKLREKYKEITDSESESEEEIIFVKNKKKLPKDEDELNDVKPYKKYVKNNELDEMRKELELYKNLINKKQKVKKIIVEKPVEKPNDNKLLTEQMARKILYW